MLLALGCQRVSPRTEPIIKHQESQRIQSGIAGKIIYINEDNGYVIVECAVLLSEMKKANVYREHRYVGKVALDGPVHFPYIVADIIEGKLQPGDRIQE